MNMSGFSTLLFSSSEFPAGGHSPLIDSRRDSTFLLASGLLCGAAVITFLRAGGLLCGAAVL
jgi:hypothetical protein